MWYIIGLAVAFGAGYITCFFMLRNNPDYVNIDKMGKDELKELLGKVEEKL